MGHKKEVIDKLNEILANQELIMSDLGIDKPQTEDVPDEPPGNDDPPRP